MAVTLILVGKTPGQSQFGLDTFTLHYKSDSTADIVLTDGSVPQKGDAHPGYAHMFVTDRYCQESGESASALDLVYTGYLTALPSQQHENSVAVQSASSLRSSTGQILTSPVTVQFYAPTSVLRYISSGAPGTDVVSDPTGTIILITITCADTTFTGGSTSALTSGFFTEQIIATSSASEIVAGRYWFNTSQKVKNLMPYAFTLSSGQNIISIFTPGTGYTVGNVLTISSGGRSASIAVTAVGVSNSVTGFSLNYGNFTTNQTGLSASGGSGGGAQFNVTVIP